MREKYRLSQQEFLSTMESVSVPQLIVLCQYGEWRSVKIAELARTHGIDAVSIYDGIDGLTYNPNSPEWAWTDPIQDKIIEQISHVPTVLLVLTDFQFKEEYANTVTKIRAFTVLNGASLLHAKSRTEVVELLQKIGTY